MLHTNQDFQIKEPRIGSLLNFGIPFLKSNLLETIYQAFVKSVKQVTTPFSKETGFEDLILLLILQIIECLKLSDFCNSLHGEPKFALLEYLVLLHFSHFSKFSHTRMPPPRNSLCKIPVLAKSPKQGRFPDRTKSNKEVGGNHLSQRRARTHRV